MKVKLLLIGIVVMLGGCDQVISNDEIIKATKVCIQFGGIDRITLAIWDRVVCTDGTIINLINATVK